MPNVLTLAHLFKYSLSVYCETRVRLYIAAIIIIFFTEAVASIYSYRGVSGFILGISFHLHVYCGSSWLNDQLGRVQVRIPDSGEAKRGDIDRIIRLAYRR